MVNCTFEYSTRSGHWRLRPAGSAQLIWLQGSICFKMVDPYSRAELDSILESIGLGGVIAECERSSQFWANIENRFK